jgi:hypothetical protein
MGRSDKRPEPPSKEDFARTVADALRQVGETMAIRFDAGEFRLLAEGEGSRIFNLANAYAEYCAAPRAKRPDVLRNYIRGWFTARREMPADFEDIRPDLLPGVRGRAYFELARLHTQADLKASMDWPYRPIAGHLGAGLVYDLPESLVQIQQHPLSDWGVAFDEALAVACANLREISRDDFDNPAPGVWVSPWRDNHDASRILLPDLIRRYEVKGDFIAMIPNRDSLLVTGSRDETGLAFVASTAAEVLEMPRPLTGLALRLEGDAWVPFLPPADHPQYRQFKKLWLRSFAHDYAEQTELLNALHEKTGEDAFVATFTGLEHPDTGKVSSYCVWSEGITSLLPRTDEIVFFRLKDKDDGEIIGMAAWDRVEKAVGNLMTPTSLYPERFRVEAFPSAEQLAALCPSGRSL